MSAVIMPHAPTTMVTTHAHACLDSLAVGVKTASILMNAPEIYTPAFILPSVKIILEVSTALVGQDSNILDGFARTLMNVLPERIIAAQMPLVQTRLDFTTAFVRLGSVEMDSSARMLMNVVC